MSNCKCQNRILDLEEGIKERNATLETLTAQVRALEGIRASKSQMIDELIVEGDLRAASLNRVIDSRDDEITGLNEQIRMNINSLKDRDDTEDRLIQDNVRLNELLTVNIKAEKERDVTFTELIALVKLWREDRFSTQGIGGIEAGIHLTWIARKILGPRVKLDTATQGEIARRLAAENRVGAAQSVTNMN